MQIQFLRFPQTFKVFLFFKNFEKLWKSNFSFSTQFSSFNQTLNSFRLFLTLMKQIFCRFECPYHGWTYSTSGRLTKATRLKGIQDFSAKNFGLVPINVEQWGPFIYINFSQEPQRNICEDFEGVRKTISEDCGAFETEMHFVKRVIYDVESNWKVDNILFLLRFFANMHHFFNQFHLSPDLFKYLAIFSRFLWTDMFV